jgi:hypothetical protein
MILELIKVEKYFIHSFINELNTLLFKVQIY